MASREERSINRLSRHLARTLELAAALQSALDAGAVVLILPRKRALSAELDEGLIPSVVSELERAEAARRNRLRRLLARRPASARKKKIAPPTRPGKKPG